MKNSKSCMILFSLGLFMVLALRIMFPSTNVISREEYYLIEDAPQLQSDYNETAKITILNPSSSSIWQGGNIYDITWDSEGPISQVKIELFKGSNQIEELTYHYTENDGNYDIYVSSFESYQEGDNYRIKVTDYNNQSIYDYSEYFTITTRRLTLIPGFGVEIFISIMIVLTIYKIIRVRKNSLRDSIHKHSSS